MITAILVVPINIFLQFLLENFANVWPGTYDDQRRFKASSNGKLNLSEAAKKSGFGKVINKAVKQGSASEMENAEDATHFAYSGLIQESSFWTISDYFFFIIQKAFICFIFYAKSFCSSYARSRHAPLLHPILHSGGLTLLMIYHHTCNIILSPSNIFLFL